MLGNYLQQTTSADDIFRCIFFFGALRVKSHFTSLLFIYTLSFGILSLDYVLLTNPICGPRLEKTCLWGFANSKGADQHAHPRSLISIFVNRLLESIISRLAVYYYSHCGSL